MSTDWKKEETLVILRTAKVDLHFIQIHPMDHGTLAGTIGFAGHKMEIDPWWENCGVTGEDVSCSCGFKSREFSGYGCWQFGHNGPPEDHDFDWLHAAMYEAAQEVGRRMWQQGGGE